MPKRTAVDRRARVQRRKVKSTTSGPESAHPPMWIKPQLTRLVDEAPAGKEWLHEIKYDGYRMHARIDGDKIQLLTRTGLDWSHRYKRTIEVLRSLKVKSAYLDGELCALNADLQAGAGRRHLQASRPTIRTGRPRDLGQVEVPQSRRVRGRWLDRPGGKPPAHRRPAAGLLHRRRSAALRRS
ncbi:MAG: ATP-dependent DNA ligase, partial [Croceibacterium sp.]